MFQHNTGPADRRATLTSAGNRLAAKIAIDNYSQLNYRRGASIAPLAGARSQALVIEPRVFRVTDNAARLALYLAHRPALINYAKAVVGEHARAEDVVQDAFLRFCASGDEPVEQPTAYLYRIVRNLALDAVRRQATEKRQTQSPPQWMQPGRQLSPEQRTLHSDDANRIATTLAGLPRAMRVALEMNRLGGYTLQQTADHLQISLSTAHRLVKEAIVHLASSIETNDLAPVAQSKESPYA